MKTRDLRGSAFHAALRGEDFATAMQLLKDSLREAQIVNPKQDETWAPPADQLGYAVLFAKGAEACQKYWKELLDYFRLDLEKAWGHTHKGHTYFRMGFAWLGTDLAKARSIIKKSVSEDRLFEQAYQKKLGVRVPMEVALARYPSFVFMQFLDLIQDAALLPQEARRTFFRGLAPTHWDVIWGPKPVDDRLVRAAIRQVVSEKMFDRALQILDGVQADFRSRNGIGLVASCAALVDALVFDKLVVQPGRRTIKGRNPAELTLAELLLEARKRKSLPQESIWSIFQCADLLVRNLPRAQKKREHNSSVIEAMAVGVKILIDLALVDWMNELAKKPSR